MAKLFAQKPSDIAVLEDISELFKFFFNRAIAAWGRGVHACIERAGQSSNAAIAQTQRQREWERLMGGDMEGSATGFDDPTMSGSTHARVVGERPSDSGDEEMVLDGDGW